MSLQEAISGSTLPVRHWRRRESHSADDRSRSSRARSSDSRLRRPREGSRRPDRLPEDRERRRRDWSEPRRRQAEHQSSLWSLIGSAGLGERDIEREIEDFARQIQEEGFLDGLDLDNIDLSRDDELSRRITEVYRRRQRGRSRTEPARRSNTGAPGGSARPVDTSSADSRLRAPDSGGRVGSRTRNRSRPRSGSGLPEDRSRPPLASSATLEVRDPARRTRRRTSSGGRRATTYALSAAPDTRPAARSQTDLTHTSDPTTPRRGLSKGRSSNTPLAPASFPSRTPSELPASAGTGSSASSTSRVPQWKPAAGEPLTSPPEPSSTLPSRPRRPADLTIVRSVVASPLSSPPASGHHWRNAGLPRALHHLLAVRQGAHRIRATLQLRRLLRRPVEHLPRLPSGGQRVPALVRLRLRGLEQVSEGAPARRVAWRGHTS